MHVDLQQLDSELAAVLSGLDARQSQLTPVAAPAKWNIQQIIEHLLLSYRSTIDTLQTRIEKGTATLARPSLQQRVGQFFLIDCGIFPAGRKAPAAVSPNLLASLRDGADLTRRVDDCLGEMDRVAANAEAMFGGRRFASHMVLGPLSAQQWRRFHLVHGRHHIKQIEAIRTSRAA